MGWIFAIVVLLLVVFIPALRIIALALIAIIVVIVVIGIADDDKKRKAKEVANAAQNAVLVANQADREKASMFPLSDLKLSEVQLSLEKAGNFSGRIRNDSSDKTLADLTLKLSISDCGKSDETDCVVIDERDVNLITHVPSGQARDFSKQLDLYFSPIVIRGFMKFDTKLIRASQ